MFFRESTKTETKPVAPPTFSILKSSRQAVETLPATKAAVQPAQQPVRTPAVQHILDDLERYKTMASAGGDSPTRQAGAAGVKLCGQRIDSVNRKLALVAKKMAALQRQLTTTTTEQKIVCQRAIDSLLEQAKADGLIV